MMNKIRDERQLRTLTSLGVAEFERLHEMLMGDATP